MKDNTPTIFYMEDDVEDLEILGYVLMILDIKVNMVHLKDGYEGLQQLYECKKKNTLPSMVLVDINMPVMNGMEVISKMKQDETLKQLPTAILSTSTKEKDFFASLGVEIIKKPAGDVKDFINHIKRLMGSFSETAPVA